MNAKIFDCAAELARALNNFTKSYGVTVRVEVEQPVDSSEEDFRSLRAESLVSLTNWASVEENLAKLQGNYGTFYKGRPRIAPTKKMVEAVVQRLGGDLRAVAIMPFGVPGADAEFDMENTLADA